MFNNMKTLTVEDLDKLVSDVGFYKVEGTTTTICTIKTISDFVIVGTSATISEENFDEEIGKKIAYDNAFEKLWELEGYYIKRTENLPKESKIITSIN